MPDNAHNSVKHPKENPMKSLERLGLKLKEQVGLEELLNENFNPQLYGLTEDQEEKRHALMEIVKTYVSLRENPQGKTITGSKDAVSLVSNSLRYLEHEEIWAAYMNNAGITLCYERLCVGTISQAMISTRDIIAKALSKNATRLILFHNHPSGVPTPSETDIKETIKLTKACKLIGLDMLDHIIVSPGSYYSFSDEMTFKFRTK